MKIIIYFCLFTVSASSWAIGGFLRSCIDRLHHSVNTTSLKVPGQQKRADIVMWPARGMAGRQGLGEQLVTVENLHEILPANLDPAIENFLIPRQGYISVSSYPSARDRLYVQSLIFAKELGRPKGTVAYTDFHFEVLSDRIEIQMKNEYNADLRPRLNYAYWIVAQHPENFPFVQQRETVISFPMNNFVEFVRRIQEMGWEFY